MNKKLGLSVLELLIGAAITAIVALALASFTSQSLKTQKNIERTLGFEEAVDLVRQSLTDKASCKIDFWSYGTTALGNFAIANDYTQLNRDIAPGHLDAYTTIDAITTKSQTLDPVGGPKTVILKKGMKLAGSLTVDNIEIAPVNNLKKFVRHFSGLTYVELVLLKISASEPLPSTKKKSFQMITNIRFNGGTGANAGAIDACYQAHPQIESVTANRKVYIVNPMVACAGTTPALAYKLPPSAYYFPNTLPLSPANMHPQYRAWCENYGSPANVLAKFTTDDPNCRNIANPSSRKRSSNVKNFERQIPFRDPSTGPLVIPFVDSLFSEEGRCPIDFAQPAYPDTGKTYFVLNPDFESAPDVLAIGCNEAEGWTATSCSIGSDGRGGALSIGFEPEPVPPDQEPRTFCVFKKPAVSGFDIGTANITIVCSKVTQ